MSKENYFQSALSNFIFEVACGGAIRHLAGQGYTARQITERLSFPTPYERVREAVTKYFLEEGILLCREPAQGGMQEKYIYVQDHGEYGRTSFRRVPVKADRAEDEGAWSERMADCREMAEMLRRYPAGAATEKAYASCDFDGRNAAAEKAFAVLDDRQQEYLRGICWDGGSAPTRPRYHLLNERMSEIVIRLCETNLFCGRVYFMSARKIFVVAANGERDDTGMDI